MKWAIVLWLFVSCWSFAEAAPVAEQIDYGALANYVRNPNSSLAANGDLVRLGTFSTGFDFAANTGNYQATAAAFTEFGSTSIGAASGSGPGRFYASALVSVSGFENRQLYVWVFDSANPTSATAWTIVTNPSWHVPTDGDFTTLDLSDPGSGVPSGALGTTTPNGSSPNGVDFVMQAVSSATPTPTASPTPTATASATPTPTATVSPTASPTPTATPTASPSPTATPVSHLANISTRLEVGLDDNVLIAGFIIQGSGPKKVIVRGIGPSLNVGGKLADPTLELHQGGSTLAVNDNWQDSQQQEVEASTIPPKNALESAIVRTLDPGAYTAILRGKNSTTGIGLVEVYDLDQDVPAKIVNISTRGLVKTAENVMIGGLIVTGPDPSRVVLRALGPSLPIGNTLADPFLELHNGHGDLVFANDNWKDTQQEDLQASSLAPKNDNESAILISLQPGNYTAIVRGAGTTTGLGLVEVYKLSP